MALPAPAVKWVFIALGVPIGIVIAWVLISLLWYKESRKDVQLANGYTLIFATRGEILKFDPRSFDQGNPEDLVVHRGWFYAGVTTAVIYTLHSERCTPAALAPVPAVFEKALLGTLVTADLNALDPEVRSIAGPMFHELIGHGSDAVSPGHLFTMLHLLWPEIAVPEAEPVQNPWKIVRRYWPLDATHPSLESRDYAAP